MLVIDAHLDLAMNALLYNRDLTQSVYTLRQERPPTELAAFPTVALPELRRGRVGLCFGTVLARSTGVAEPHLDFPSTAQAYAAAQGQLAYYRALERLGHIRVIGNHTALETHIATWQTWEQNGAQGETPTLGVIVSMESADPILSPTQLDEWWSAGLRIIGPAHYGPGCYAGGTGTEFGLSENGRELLRAMARHGVALDTTHLSDEAFWQALEVYDGPVLASHNNCRTLVPKQRQFSDEQLQALIARGGVIGVALDAIMLMPGWIIGASNNADVTLELVADHIDHICQLAGNACHAAIGTDLDGGFGRAQSPCDLDTIADLQKLPKLLAQRGYAETDIANICHGNWLRWLYTWW